MMGWRFRRSIKVLPGVRLNVSKSGTSWSLGPRGLKLNVGGARGERLTAGVPGTGVSFSERIGDAAAPRATQARSAGGELRGVAGSLVGLALTLAQIAFWCFVLFWAARLGFGLF